MTRSLPSSLSRRWTGPANVELRIVPKGGHLGWLGWDGAGGIRWGERQVANWILNRGGEQGA